MSAEKEEVSRDNLLLDNALCTKIAKKYFPFGFENLMPKSLKDLCGDLQGKLKRHFHHHKTYIETTKKCDTKPDQDEFCEENDDDTMHIDEFPQLIDNVRVPNIIMLGKTGAGKSFFGSGLFGAENPDKGLKNIIFIFPIQNSFRGFSNK